MATLTIRNVPSDLHAQLREKARQNRRSLNQEVIAELLGAEGVTSELDEERKRRRAEDMLGKVREMRRGLKDFMTAEGIDAAMGPTRGWRGRDG